MFNIIENIKNELYSNNKLNFHVILFILSEPVALSAAYFMIMRGIHCWNKPNTFLMTTFYTVLLTGSGFLLRIPYMWNKPSALFFLIFNCIAWIITIFIWIRAFYLYKFYKKSTKKSTKKSNSN